MGSASLPSGTAHGVRDARPGYAGAPGSACGSGWTDIPRVSAGLEYDVGALQSGGVRGVLAGGFWEGAAGYQ
jgi:hypothetical protein